MRNLKIKFVDFWNTFQPQNNFFWNELSKYFQLELSDNPDILFYSVFGNENYKYTCYRIFYTGENIRPDFRFCDIALSFDYNSHPFHVRLPLYTRLFDLAQLKESNRHGANYPVKTKFCCMVVSNPDCAYRNRFFEKLSAYKPVDSGGRFMNNIGYNVPNKSEFIKDYKFVISFENSEYPGYTTEKIVEPMLCGSIPIYWGNPLVNREFNTKSFVNIYDFENEEALFNYIREIDSNDDLFFRIQRESAFIDDELKIEQIPDATGKILYNRIVVILDEKPVALSSGYKYLRFKQSFIKSKIVRKSVKIYNRISNLFSKITSVN